MLENKTLKKPGNERKSSYTTVRSDVVQLVPESALQILDVGCSNGALGRELKNMVPLRNVFGIELDHMFSVEAAENIDYVVNADINKIDWSATLGDRRFDCIIFSDILEHLVDPYSCVNSAIKYLRPNGCVVISLPNIRHISAFCSIFILGRFPRRDRGIFDRTHLHWFTIRDVYEIIFDCRMKVLSINQALRWGDVGGGRINRLLNRLPLTIKKWAPIREFFTYQICICAEASVE